MKTVGEAFEVGRRIRLDVTEFVADDVFQRRRLALALPISSRDT